MGFGKVGIVEVYWDMSWKGKVGLYYEGFYILGLSLFLILRSY